MAILPLRKSGEPRRTSPGFSLDAELIAAVLTHARPLGHHESVSELNLGFGFLYYALVRALRPRHVVVIGSGYGFSVACLALGLVDNDRGQLSFVDPAYSVITDGPFKTIGGTAQWTDPEQVRRHFSRFGVAERITHYRIRSEEFYVGYETFGLPAIDLAFIDGNHSYANVKHDFCETLRHAHCNSYILLHDTNIYVRELVRHAGVKRWLRALQREPRVFETVDFPFASGVAIVRVLHDEAWQALQSSSLR
jgi:predicted O-methyltransferase YrrM